MSPSVQLRLGAVIVASGLGAMNDDLRWAWAHSPYDQGAGWVALVWVLIVMAMVGARALPNVGMLITAVGLGLVSLVGDLNVARHLAWVVLLASFAPNRREAVVISLGGLAWWPALGWGLAKVVSSDFGCVIRVAWLAVFGSLGLWLVRSRKQKALK